jgi:hypothetical protein
MASILRTDSIQNVNTTNLITQTNATTITLGASGQTIITASGATFLGGGIVWQNVQTTNFTAVAGRGYPVNTTSAGITVTLPSSAVAGNTIQIVDYAGTFQTNNLTVNPNGLNFNGSTSNATISQKNEGLQLTYIDSTQGWKQILASNEGQGVPYTASYLVIAGGGSGGQGSRAGAGGAGGLLTSTTTLTPGTVYTATIGGAGVLTASYNDSNLASSGVSGSNSSLIGGSVSVTTIGGGGGQVGDGGTALSGGSGGGAWYTGTGGSGTSGQGYAGGSAATSANFGAGGGGGSGGVGGNGSTSTGGNGGAGTVSSITGSSVTYAGGGSSDIYGGYGHSAGTATGGGGVGNNTSPTHQSGTDATANTGGGGGSGGSGGSGVVILSVPTANYSGKTTGSPTITTSGSNTIIKFTAIGSYTG